MDQNNLQNSVYQNAAMGITALRQIIPSVRDHNMKDILIKQYNGYKRQTEITARQMKADNLTPTFPSLGARMMTKASIALKMRRDHSPSNAAKMLIKGTNAGIIDLTETINHTGCESPEAIASAKEYLKKEQSYIESLKPYL
ncbi:MAG: hypothetical protein NC120_09410 [Ruminococcus sp.]|nr:hypothetical protein [Ruminococcus sp.]